MRMKKPSVIQALTVAVPTILLILVILGGVSIFRIGSRIDRLEEHLLTPHAAVVASNDGQEPGISDNQILFGQSAVLSGSAEELGKGMRLGIETAFHEVNQAGGAHGRMLTLKTLDDFYEPGFSVQTTQWLIEREEVFALVGAVGTPTSRVAYPLAHDAGVPFLFPFTGAEFLRDPELDKVVNLRASYYQETEEIVAYLTEDLGITRIAVCYQDDSYGLNGLEGVRLALDRRGQEVIGTVHFQRNSGELRRASASIVELNPEAVIVIGAYQQAAKLVKTVRPGIDPIFVTVSFGGGNGLVEALGDDGDGFYVSQVVPYPEDSSIPIVARYRAALSSYNPEAEPGFVSLEGYLAGRLAIFALDACGRELSRKCFLDALLTSEVIDIDGFQLEYGLNGNRGSDEVYLTVIGADGKYHLLR